MAALNSRTYSVALRTEVADHMSSPRDVGTRPVAPPVDPAHRGSAGATRGEVGPPNLVFSPTCAPQNAWTAFDRVPADSAFAFRRRLLRRCSA